MNAPKNNPINQIIWISALLLISVGGCLVVYHFVFGPHPNSITQTTQFVEAVAVPFDWVQIGPISFPITIDNFLIFEEFESISPIYNSREAYIFGGIFFLISSVLLVLISEFSKTYFSIAATVWIALLTFGNFNGLNIGGLNTNMPLIILISGSLLPIISFHIWGENIRFWIKWLIASTIFGSTIAILIYFSTIINPSLYLVHHATVVGFGLSLAWILWSGHAVISGSYLLLCRVNRNIGIKISSQMMVISGLYLILLTALYLNLIGDSVGIIPIFNPLFLVFPIGILGWQPLKAKLKQSHGLAAGVLTLKVLYLLGFAMSLWLIWKLEISENRPASELFKHLLVYSQFGFSMFFMVYLFSNFFSLMNSGKPVEEILFKPHYLAYYHLRIGGLIAILLLTTISDGIVGIQVNSMTTNILGDYFYETDQKLEASILYENAWARYRNNPKAKQATAHLLFQLNQPSQAKQHLEESFSQAPQVENIILLSNRLHRENKIFESIYYLERGLKIFADEPKLINNLALLYSKINREKEALKLLENSKKTHPILHSNLLAIQIKNGEFKEGNNESNLNHQINQLAASNLLGNMPSEDLLKSIQAKLQKTASPMSLHAAMRNIHSQKNRSNPDQDLNLLDSLALRDDMQDHILSLQKTTVIRNLGAGNISEAIKNLNGLAFRNPSDAGYFLHLSSMILAQNLDFKKAAKELVAATEKGFQDFKPYHLAIFDLSGMSHHTQEIRLKHQTKFPDYLQQENGNMQQYLNQIGNFHEFLGIQVFEVWKTFDPNELKNDLALRILTHKSHDLEQVQITQLNDYLADAKEQKNDPEISSAKQNEIKPQNLKYLIDWLKVSDQLTANPYLTPLIIIAAAQCKDPLMAYEILNNATEFNADPMLQLTKIKAARNIGLDNYANEAFLDLSNKIPFIELLRLQEKTSIQ